MAPTASTSPHSIATASGLMLGTLALAIGAGLLLGWALGDAGIGFLAGAILGIPAAIAVTYLVYAGRRP